MNRKAPVVIFLSLLTVLMMIVVLNIRQNSFYNDTSVAVYLNKGYANEKNVFADNSTASKPYRNIKLRKSSANYTNNTPSDLNVPMNTQSRIKVRNSGRKSIDVTNSVSASSMGLSYDQKNNLNKSNEGYSGGAGSLGYATKGSSNSSGEGGASGGGLMAYQSTLVGQTSSYFVPYNNGNGNSILIDPSTDPLEAERIPVGDGVGLLSLFALLYAVWKLYLFKNN